MNTKQIILTTSGLLLSGSLTQAAISWDGTTVTNVEAANTVISANGTSAGGVEWDGISMTMEASVGSNEFRFNPNNTSQIRFRPTTAIGTGESITFKFDFNMQLFTGVKNTPRVTNPASARAGFGMRLNNATANIDITTDVTVTGGTNTLQGFFGANAPSAGDALGINPDVLYFNPDGAEGAFHTWAEDKARFDSFSNGGNTASFSEFTTGATDTHAVVLGDSNVTRTTTDFSYDYVEYTITNNSTTDIAANALFIFSFEGVNPAAQALVPEPASVALLGLGLVGVASRRRR